jgi:EpsI family protein
MVFMVSAALMLGEIGLLNLLGEESGSWRQLFGVEFPAASPQGALRRQRAVPRQFIAAVVLLAGFAAVSWLMPRPQEIIPERASFSDFPLEIGAWSGRRRPLERTYLDALKLDDYMLADYAKDGRVVNLYVAYYNSQRKGEAVHSPRACMPGGGWQLSDFNQRTLANINVNGRPLRVNRTLIALGDERQLVYYWFEQRGRVITNEFVVKWYLFWDALTRNRTDGALVRVITQVPHGGSEADADAGLVDLVSHLPPVLPVYVPN